MVLAVVAVAVAAVVGWMGWHWVARPAAIEDRMPLASSSSPMPSSPSSSSSPSSPSSASSAHRGTTPAGVGATAAGPGATGATGSPGAVGAPGSPDSDAPGTTQVTVHVAGAVLAPGVVTLAPGARVVDAVRAAGGLAADADSDRINLAAPLVDGSRIAVPRRGEGPPVEVPTSVPVAPAGPAGRGSAGSGTGSAPAAPVDLNTATAEQFDALPGIGPSTATAIIARRDQSGPFRSVDDLLDVRGIGPAKLDAIRNLVTVG